MSAQSSPSPDFEPDQSVSCQYHPANFARRRSRAAIGTRRISSFTRLQSRMEFSHGPGALPSVPSIAERHLLLVGTLVPKNSPRKPSALPIAPFALPVPGDRGDYPVLVQRSKGKVEHSVPRPAIDGSRTRYWRKRNGQRDQRRKGLWSRSAPMVVRSPWPG